MKFENNFDQIEESGKTYYPDCVIQILVTAKYLRSKKITTHII